MAKGSSPPILLLFVDMEMGRWWRGADIEEEGRRTKADDDGRRRERRRRERPSDRNGGIFASCTRWRWRWGGLRQRLVGKEDWEWECKQEADVGLRNDGEVQ